LRSRAATVALFGRCSSETAGTCKTDLAAVSLLVRARYLQDARRLLDRLAPEVPQRHLRWAADEIREAEGDVATIERARQTGVPWTRVMTGWRAFLYSETLARALHQRGDVAAAIRVLEETSPLRERLFNRSSHSGYFWMRNQALLADLYRSAGRIDDARAIERDLRDMLATADAGNPMVLALRRSG